MTVNALPSREQALELLEEWVQNAALRRHCRCVETAMRAYANRFGEDEARWGLAGLIHDFDWERHPDAGRHPTHGVEVLRQHGWPDDILRAVLGHANHTGVPRDSLMARTLFACDELCGFIVACSLVMPGRTLAEVEAPSVRKRLKRSDFARNVNREDIVNGAAELGVDLDEHIAFVLAALKAAGGELEE